MKYFINKKNGCLITASSKNEAIKVFAGCSKEFFELVNELDDNKIKYDKTTMSFDIEKGVVINNSYLLKLIGTNFIYGTISSVKETENFEIVKKWLDSLVKRLKPVEKKPSRVPLKDLFGERKQVEQIRRKLYKFKSFKIKDLEYPVRVKSLDKDKRSFILDYKDKRYEITPIDSDGFIVGRTYRTTNFETFLESVYNHVLLETM